jgi:hypothetical protein
MQMLSADADVLQDRALRHAADELARSSHVPLISGMFLFESRLAEPATSWCK